MFVSKHKGKKRNRFAHRYYMEAKKAELENSPSSAAPKAIRNGEIADQIKEMFAEKGFTEKSANCFNIISNNLFDLIMKSVADEARYRPMYDKYIRDWELANARTSMKLKMKYNHKPMNFRTFYLKKFYQLQFVDRRFAEYFNRRIKDLPKVDIGVRIQHKAERTKSMNKDVGKVVFCVHNGFGILPSNVCDFLENIDKVLRFGRVTSHFTVFGLPLDDYLLAAIKKIDTSQVTNAHFLNIPYVDFGGDVKENGQMLLSMFPMAELIDFNGSGYDQKLLFGDSTGFNNSGLYRRDIELSAVQMAQKCVKVTAASQTPRGKKRFAKAEKRLCELASPGEYSRMEVRDDVVETLGAAFANFEVGDFSDEDEEMQWLD